LPGTGRSDLNVQCRARKDDTISATPMNLDLTLKKIGNGWKVFKADLDKFVRGA
jgi:hypothetical protein